VTWSTPAQHLHFMTVTKNSGNLKERRKGEGVKQELLYMHWGSALQMNI